MAVSYGPKIGTANVPDGFADGDTYTPPMDRFLRMNQAVIQLNAISYAVSAPPGSPTEGDTYLVPAGATGAWSGQDQSVAYWTMHDLANPSGVWEFYVPRTGWFAYDQADGNFYKFNGIIWVALTFAPSVFTTLPAWWLSGEGSSYAYAGVGEGNGTWSTGTANVIKVWYIRLPYAINVRQLSYRHNVSLAGSHSAFGLYSADGNTKLFSWDNFDTNVGAGLKTKILTPTISLPPGVYAIGCGSDTTGTSPGTQGGFLTVGSSESSQPQNAAGTVRLGTAANPLVGASMPATLGAISLAAVGNVLPLFCMEP